MSIQCPFQQIKMKPAAREPLSPLVTDNFAPERKELVWDSM